MSLMDCVYIFARFSNFCRYLNILNHVCFNVYGTRTTTILYYKARVIYFCSRDIVCVYVCFRYCLLFSRIKKENCDSDSVLNCARVVKIVPRGGWWKRLCAYLFYSWTLSLSPSLSLALFFISLSISLSNFLYVPFTCPFLLWPHLQLTKWYRWGAAAGSCMCKCVRVWLS